MKTHDVKKENEMKTNKVTFGTLQTDGTLSNVRMIKQSDMMRCPHCIMVVDHYRENGSCRCNDPSHKEMSGWGYKWNGKGWN